MTVPIQLSGQDGPQFRSSGDRAFPDESNMLDEGAVWGNQWGNMPDRLQPIST